MAIEGWGTPWVDRAALTFYSVCEIHPLLTQYYKCELYNKIISHVNSLFTIDCKYWFIFSYNNEKPNIKIL